MDPRTALFQVCLRGDVPYLEHLLAQNPLLLDRFLTQTDALHETPLHVTARAGHSKVVTVLLNHKPEMTRVRSQEGEFPIHLASAKGHVDIVKKMLELDPILSLVGDKNGRTPIHVAAACNQVAVLKAMLSVDEGFVNVPSTGFGETILHSCVKHNQFEATKFILRRHKELVHAKDYEGNTALHHAAKRRNSLIAKYILNETNARVNDENQYGHTPLDMALQTDVGNEDRDFCKILSDNGGRNGRLGSKQKQKASDEEWLRYVQNSIIVVATLIMGATYQAGLQPPSRETSHPWFKLFNAISLGASTGLILLLASGEEIKRLLAKSQLTRQILILILWFSLLFMTLAFGFGTLYKSEKEVSRVPKGFLYATLVLMGIMFFYHIIKILSPIRDKKTPDRDQNLEVELVNKEKPERPFNASARVQGMYGQQP